MDPALWELLLARQGAGPGGEVDAIVRFVGEPRELPGLRIVARFGSIVTCRITAADVVRVHARPEVRSVKAARALGPGLLERSTGHPDPRTSDLRRPPGLRATGAGVVVGSVDWGLDIDAPCFRWPVERDGSVSPGGTRLLALWDQRSQHTRPAPQPYGYGVVHTRADINAALRSADPYGAIGYHPSIADTGSGSHGTHVLDIAAGNGLGNGPAGMAPGADLVFVHLADRNTGGLANLGDSVRLLEAIDFVARTAGSRPWVVNLSLGRTGGPHDCTTPVELAFEQLLATATGCQIVQSAGNYRSTRTHTYGFLSEGERRSFSFVVQPGDPTPNELEIWYDGADEFVVHIDPPGSSGAPGLELGRRAELYVDDQPAGRVYHRRSDPNNGDHFIDAFLESRGLAGTWTVTLDARRVTNGRFDAWLERDDSCPDCQARFLRSDSRPSTTTGTIANGHTPLVVGAYDGHDPLRAVTSFSSWGPTRDGRVKPDLIAPGQDVLAARSAPAGSRASTGAAVRKSGTSMATPHVTGAVAMCLELLGAAATPQQIRDLVLATCEPTTAEPRNRAGHGFLDVDALIAETTLRAEGAHHERPRREAIDRRPRHDVSRIPLPTGR